MIKLPDALIKLIDSFKMLPGVGGKTAERLAYFVLEKDFSYSKSFAQNLLNLDNNILTCDFCFFFSRKRK